MDIIEFLTARYDEDEQFAIEASREGDHWVPAQVLADFAAKRRILEWCGERERIWIGTVADDPDNPKPEDFIDGGPTHREGHIILRLLASPFSDHPDFNPDWRVDA